MRSVLRILPLVVRADILIPTLLILAYLVLIFLARGTIPTSEELVEAFVILYSEYGYEIIFASAFLESLVIVNYFVPGSLALALGVIFARTGVTDLTTVVTVALFGAILGYQLDYFLGYFGLGEIFRRIGYHHLLVLAKSQLRRFGREGLMLGFIHANLASLLALSAGATNFGWLKFLWVSTLSTLFWGILWSILIYSLGEVFLEILKKYSLLLFIMSFSLILLSSFWRGGKR